MRDQWSFLGAEHAGASPDAGAEMPGPDATAVMLGGLLNGRSGENRRVAEKLLRVQK